MIFNLLFSRFVALSAALLPVADTKADAPALPVELFAYDAQSPLEVRLVPLGGEAGVNIFEAAYASPAGGQVTGRLYVPAQPGPHAGIVYAHGTGAGARTQGPRAVYLARHGAVVLTPDAPYIRRGGEFPTFTDLDRVEQIQHIRELRRGFDLLLARADVAPDRLAFIGRSHGGAMGVLLVGVEPRIKTAILIVADGGMVAHFTGGGGATELFEAQPETVRHQWIAAMIPIEPARFIHLAPPTSILFQNGRQDNAVAPSLAEALHAAARGEFEVHWYDAGHRLNVQSFVDQLDWLHRRIGMQAPGPDAGDGPKFPAPARR
jgi:dienelactone hydrolase